jgi:hypothetical protein
LCWTLLPLLPGGSNIKQAHDERYVSRCCHRQTGRPRRASRFAIGPDPDLALWAGAGARAQSRGLGWSRPVATRSAKKLLWVWAWQATTTTDHYCLWSVVGGVEDVVQQTTIILDWLLVACSLCCKTFCYRYEIRHTSTLCTLHRPSPHQAALASSPTPSCACTCSLLQCTAVYAVRNRSNSHPSITNLSDLWCGVRRPQRPSAAFSLLAGR